MAAVQPPVYTVSAPAPVYSSLPLPTEESVEFTPRAGSSQLPGTLTRRWKRATVILKGQEDQNATTPSYGRNAVIDGEIEFKKPERLVDVSVKLEGRMSLSISDCGSADVKIVSEKHIIWKKDCDDKAKHCPTVLPFAVPFPTTYKDCDGRIRKLPPTYQVVCFGFPSTLCATCCYTLIITVTRLPILPFWPASTTYTIPLEYCPRTRPHRPILPMHPLFSSIKSLPDEWHHITTTVRVKPKQLSTQPIQCHFLIPVAQTYSLTDNIPFHIQLCASVHSLREFFSPSGRPNSMCDFHEKRVIRVFLARQILIEVNGRQSCRNCSVGEGKLWPVAPAENVQYSEEAEATVDWEGVVRCRNDVKAGSFNVGSLVVKDFIVLSLIPTNPRSSAFIALQHAHPIRLVTNSWTADDALHPQDR